MVSVLSVLLRPFVNNSVIGSSLYHTAHGFRAFPIRCELRDRMADLLLFCPQHLFRA